MSLPPFVEVTDLEAYQSGDAEAILGQAQGALRAYCGWHVSPDLDETLTLDGQGGRHLWLPSLKVNSITSITELGVVVDLDDVDWSESGYLERRCGHWTSRPRQIVVELNHGYEDAPAELVEVVVSIASRASSSPSGAVDEGTGPFRAKWSAVAPGVAGGLALLQHERDILDKYKLPPRA